MNRDPFASKVKNAPFPLYIELSSQMIKLGFLLTSIYVVAIAWFMHGRWAELKELSLPDLGEFVAGVFSVPTFLWLIVGYIQQGKELKLNTEVLTDQAKELKATSEHQKKLVEQSIIQSENNKKMLEHQSKQFNLYISPSFNLTTSTSCHSGNKYSQAFEITNLGNKCPAANISVTYQDHENKKIHKEFHWTNIKEGEINKFEINFIRPFSKNLSMELSYKTLTKEIFKENFRLVLKTAQTPFDVDRYVFINLNENSE